MASWLDDPLLNKVVSLLKDRQVSAYLVGGTVRDRLLGRDTRDIDFAIQGDAMRLGREIADALKGAYVPLDESRNTSRVVLREEKGPPIYLDFAGLRGPTIEADLAARDFTVNAMAVRIEDLSLASPPVIDPHNGLQDLKNRRVQAVSEGAFRDDPVRLIRSVRVAADIEGELTQETEDWIRRDAALLTQTSAERIRDELVKLLLHPYSAQQVRRLGDLGVLEHALPEVWALRGVTQSAPHVYDAYEHTLVTLAELEDLLLAIEGAPPEEDTSLAPLLEYAAHLAPHLSTTLVGDRPRWVLLKLAALYHDVGKPAVRTEEPSGRVRFFHHERVGADLAVQALRRLRFGTREVQLVSTIVRHHMRPLLLGNAEQVTRRAVYRFFRDAGSAGLDILILSLADYRDTRGPTLTPEGWARRVAVVKMFLDRYFLQHSPVVSPPKLIDGHEVMEVFNLKPGPQIGQLLEAVREAQAEGLVATREEALHLIEGLLTSPDALEALSRDDEPTEG